MSFSQWAHLKSASNGNEEVVKIETPAAASLKAAQPLEEVSKETVASHGSGALVYGLGGAGRATWIHVVVPQY